ERVLERTPREPDRARRRVDPGDVEPVLERVERRAVRLRNVALGQAAEPVRRRHAEPVETEVERRQAVVADLVDRGGRKARGNGAALLLDQQRDEPAALRLAGRGVGLAREEDDEVGLHRVAAPALLTADDVLVAVALRAT